MSAERDSPSARAASHRIGWPLLAVGLVLAAAGIAAGWKWVRPPAKVRAARAYSAGNFAEAAAVYEEQLRLDPADREAHEALARIFHQQRRPKDALPHALRATELAPDRAGTWLLIAEIYDDLRRTHEMIEPLRKALALNPNLAEAHLNLCYALIWSGETAEARLEAQWCLARDPRSAPAHRFLAMCEREEGRPEQALEEIRRALALVPDDIESRLVEGQLLLYLRRADEAYRELEPLLQQRPDDRRLLNLLARAAAASGRREEAAKYQERASGLLKKSPRPVGEG
jgi:tetratricopeptide (TPR) repeat protein